MSKLIKAIKPSYLQNFKCIGGICEDSCCIGWNIDIDKITYRKYFRTNNTTIKKRFQKHLHKNENCDFEEIDYGRMKILNNKWCPFLNSEKLCDIFSTLGEDYLSNVCHSYPRIYNVLDNKYEISLYMSCPEAVRMILLNKKPMKFHEESITLDKHIIHSYVNTNDKQFRNSPIKQLKELRTTSIRFVQDRTMSINERLILLGEFLSKNNKKKPLEVSNIYTFQLSFFNNMIEILNVFSEIDSPLFVDHTKNLLDTFNLESTSYQDSMQSIVEPYINNNAYLFENFLVNSIYQSNFPFNINLEKFDGYLVLIIKYCFIRFYLSGIAIKNGELTTNDIVAMVQLHSKTINHHNTFIKETLEIVKERGFNNLSFVTNILG